MTIVFKDNEVKRMKCNKCNGKGLLLRETNYGMLKEIRCNSCLHTWVFDGFEKLEDIIKEITNTKPPRIGYH